MEVKVLLGESRVRAVLLRVTFPRCMVVILDVFILELCVVFFGCCCFVCFCFFVDEVIFRCKEGSGPLRPFSMKKPSKLH